MIYDFSNMTIANIYYTLIHKCLHKKIKSHTKFGIFVFSTTKVSPHFGFTVIICSRRAGKDLPTASQPGINTNQHPKTDASVKQKKVLCVVRKQIPPSCHNTTKQTNSWKTQPNDENAARKRTLKRSRFLYQIAYTEQE